MWFLMDNIQDYVSMYFDRGIIEFIDIRLKNMEESFEAISYSNKVISGEIVDNVEKHTELKILHLKRLNLKYTICEEEYGISEFEDLKEKYLKKNLMIENKLSLILL